jgi:multiple sugar transport system permease protein
MSSRPDLTAPVHGMRRRRPQLPKLSRDGLSTFVFLLPALLIFGLFSWFPIVRSVVMSVQETNLVSGAPGGGGRHKLHPRTHPPVGKEGMKNTWI